MCRTGRSPTRGAHVHSTCVFGRCGKQAGGGLEPNTCRVLDLVCLHRRSPTHGAHVLSTCVFDWWGKRFKGRYKTFKSVCCGFGLFAWAMSSLLAQVSMRSAAACLAGGGRARGAIKVNIGLFIWLVLFRARSGPAPRGAISVYLSICVSNAWTYGEGHPHAAVHWGRWLVHQNRLFGQGLGLFWSLAQSINTSVPPIESVHRA